jgi:hypothetical protein
MSRRRLAIVPRQARQADDRAALGQAIVALAAARQAGAANEAAISRAKNLSAQRDRAVEEAEAAVEAAKDQFAGAMATASADDNESPIASPGVVAAEAALSKATNALQAARAAAPDRLRSFREERRAAINAGEETLSGSVATVTIPAIESWLTCAERAIAELSRCVPVLAYLLHPDDDPADRGLGLGCIRPRLPDELDRRGRGFLNRQFVGMLRFNQLEDAGALVQRYRDWRAQLRVDAGAPAPPLPDET